MPPFMRWLLESAESKEPTQTGKSLGKHSLRGTAASTMQQLRNPHERRTDMNREKLLNTATRSGLHVGTSRPPATSLSAASIREAMRWSI
jgi:hypothetical protein